MPALRFFLVVLVVGLATPVSGQNLFEVAGAPSLRPHIDIPTLTTIARPGGGGRSPVFTDAIEKALVEGTFEAPTDGDVLVLPDGTTHTWQTIEADENGLFEHANLRGGYGVAVVESDSEKIWMLHAQGHRHVLVNGVPRGGDVYDHGFVRLPVRLREGENVFVFKGGRGRLTASVVSSRPLEFTGMDHTLPHVLRGSDGAPLWLGICVTNATDRWQTNLRVGAETRAGMANSAEFSLPPVSQRKIAVPVYPPGGESTPSPAHSLQVKLELKNADEKFDTFHLDLAFRNPTEKHVRTFVSNIDGSVQKYAVTPRIPSEDQAPGALVLTLHGAGVDGGRQAHHYAPKEWATVVSPTNRRAFGFDWEDWGRLDALEVLHDALSRGNFDPRQVYLTGHSMGGHGTWNMGVHYPDRFAAIGPSAGWRDFWSYGAGGEPENPTPIEKMLSRAANGSRTLLLERNTLHGGVYVLHGDKDSNVPVEQARFMRQRLAAFHPNFAYYERPGAGHWWGDQCMDWPPMFEFFRQNRIPEAHTQTHVEFHTVSPVISARCYWVRVEGQERWHEPSSVDVRLVAKERQVVATTQNVTHLVLDLAPFAKPRTQEKKGAIEDATILPAGEPVTVVIDGATLVAPWPEDATLRLDRGGTGWRLLNKALAPWYKGSHRAGPFKEAFRNRVQFVVGTQGDAEENAWALAKARYDAETFYYRGNGSIEIVRDIDFDPKVDPDRNVVLYGNADTNSAWLRLFPRIPIDVRRGKLRVGNRRVNGSNLACLFIYPRMGSDTASVGVVSGTGMKGMRLTNQLPYFVSGVGYPDWIVIGPDMLETGSAGVRGAGFFRGDWSTEGGDEAWWREATGR